MLLGCLRASRTVSFCFSLKARSKLRSFMEIKNLRHDSRKSIASNTLLYIRKSDAGLPNWQFQAPRPVCRFLMYKHLAAIADVYPCFQGSAGGRQSAAIQGVNCGRASGRCGGRRDAIGFVAQLERLATCAHEVGAEGCRSRWSPYH